MESTKLLVIAFLIKFLARNHIFKYIREKYGHDASKLCRSYEKLSLRKQKVELDLNFLVKCRKENLSPKFADPKLSIRSPEKLKKKISKLIIQTEIKNKHTIKKTILKDLRNTIQQIQNKTSFLTHQALKYKVRLNVAYKKGKWQDVHEKKLQNLLISTSNNNILSNDDFSRKTIHNFSSYILSEKEVNVLSRTLDDYVPFKTDVRRMEVEFEKFYQTILPHTSNLGVTQKSRLKSKFLNVFHEYSNIKCPWKDKRIVEGLMQNNEIVLLKQDKGRGVVILNKNDYINKSLEFLSDSQFVKLDVDPTKSFQTKIQTTLRKMKTSFAKNVYTKIYPSSSQPGLFFGLAKVHKVPINSENVEDLPLRPVISNCGTATYEVSKHLASVLAPLTKNVYTVNDTRDFINKLKLMTVNDGEKVVSFDVSSLFSNVPLDYTIEVILRKIYTEKLIKTKLKKQQFKELLELCTKELHFSFNGEMFRQVDGVAMGSPLGPVLANIFMAELESQLIPKLSHNLSVWFRYVDDTFTIIRDGEIENVKNVLNSFHPKIKFTHEVETGKHLAFLDVSVHRNTDNSFSTSVYRKPTDTNVYIHWKAHAPKIWKIGTLKGLFRRAFLISSNDIFLQQEIDFLKNVFIMINKYPKKVVNNTLKAVKDKINRDREAQLGGREVLNIPPVEVDTEVTHPAVILPFTGLKGENIVRGFKNVLRDTLPQNVVPRFVYKGKKLGSFFRIKDKIDDNHKSNLIYGYTIPGNETGYDYIGMSKVRHGTRVYEHLNTDKGSAIFQHKEAHNISPTPDNFDILAQNYNGWLERRICESLYARDYQPLLNKQKITHKLELFT